MIKKFLERCLESGYPGAYLLGALLAVPFVAAAHLLYIYVCYKALAYLGLLP